MSDTSTSPWRRYIGEFLSLFLAVSLGFFVDNYREEREDRHRERVLMQQVLQDLASDKERLDTNLVLRHRRGTLMDSLLDMATPAGMRGPTSEFYYLTQAIRLRSYFEPTNGAFDQLFGGGGLQFVQRVEIIAAIQRYRNNLANLMALQAIEEGQLDSYRNGPMPEVVDAVVVRSIRDGLAATYDERTRRPAGNPPLLTTDPMKLNRLFQSVASMVSMNESSVRVLHGLDQQIHDLVRLIAMTYGLSTNPLDRSRTTTTP